MALTKFQSNDPTLQLLQSSWASSIDPVLANPFLKGNVLTNVALANGTTIVNHKLGRTLQGWVITDVNGAATIYRSQPKNDLTLTLVSNAAVTASIYVF